MVSSEGCAMGLRRAHELRECWLCDQRELFDRREFVECFISAESEADLKSCVEKRALPVGCRNCKRGVDPASERSMRDLYLDVVYSGLPGERDERAWPAGADTYFGTHLATVDTSSEEYAEKLQNAVQTEITRLGFRGFVSSAIVTQNASATVSALLRARGQRDVEEAVTGAVRSVQTPVGVPARDLRGYRVPTSLGWSLENLPSAVLLLEKKTPAHQARERHIIVNVSLAKLLEDAEQMRRRLRLELLQPMIRHLQGGSAKAQRRALRGQGMDVSPAVFGLAAFLLGEGVVHSSRYTHPDTYGLIHRHRAMSELPTAMGLYGEYYDKACRNRNPRQIAVFHYLYYVKVQNGIIECLARAFAGNPGEVPPIVSGIAGSSDDLRDLFARLGAFSLKEMYACAPGDMARFVASVVFPHAGIFDELLRVQEEQEHVFREFAALMADRPPLPQELPAYYKYS